MPKGVNRALRLSTALLVIVSYLSLTTVSSFGVEVMLVPVLVLALMPLAERWDRKTPAYKRATGLVTLFFSCALLPLLLLRFGPLVGLTVLCMYIVTYFLLHEKKSREYQYIFLMAFFFLVSACAQNPEPFFGIAALLFILSLVWAFAMLQIAKEGSGACDLPIGDLIPLVNHDSFVPTESLGSVRAPRVITGPLTLYLLGTAFCCLILSLGIFLTTPRMEAGVLGGTSITPSRNEATNTVDLSIGGPIGTDLSAVMRVRFPSEPGGQYRGTLYWRVTTLNRFSGTEWARENIDEERFDDRRETVGHGSGPTITRENRREQGMVLQDIYLDDPPPWGLPCLPFPVIVSARNASLAWDQTGDLTVVVRRKQNSSINYVVRSDIDASSPEELRRYPARYARLGGERNYPLLYERVLGRRAYSVLTRESLSPRGRELAMRIAAPYDNPYDQAEAIVRWFQQSNFVYTLNVPDVQGADPIDQFLFQTQAGHCELYASAMALMLRAVGIPCRVVSGYRGGEWDTRDGVYVVRKSMAHLWVEVYFVGQGWVTFDPTPEIDLPGTEIGSLARFVSRNILNLKMVWFRDVVGYSGGIRLDDLRDISLGLAHFDFDVVKGIVQKRPILSGVVPRLLFWLLILSAGVWAVVHAILPQAPRKRARQIFTPDQIRATRLWAKLKRRLRRMGVECRGRTAGEIYGTLQGGVLELATPIGRIIEAYRQARFGGRPLDKRRYAELNRVIRTLRVDRSRS